jgi:putative ABC transport system permease protein
MITLVLRHLLGHKGRTVLTALAVMIAVFLLCVLRTLVTALDAGVEAASSSRLMVQSAVSLFVGLPVSYQDRIAAVDGVQSLSKWQWFGGIYQDPSNFFGQFAVDHRNLFDVYPEIVVDAETRARFEETRNGCIVGHQLATEHGWKTGDRVPLIGALYPHPDGADVAWEFEVAGTYRSDSAAVDNRTMLFHWDFFEETQEAGGGAIDVGVIVLKVAPGADVSRIIAQVDEMYENGPQRVRTTTEKEFQRQFVSMVGNIPMFVAWIGGGVLIAILLACVNTMLMAARQQTHDVGILKALGFTDGAAFRIMLAQALILCALGGAAGIVLALAVQPMLIAVLGAFFPGYAITSGTLVLAAAVTLLLGLVSGIVPAMRSSRLRVVEALRSAE